MLFRAGLLSADEGLESFDFRYLLGSPEKVGKVRQVLQTVFRRHTATGYLMLSAVKHVLAIIPRREFERGEEGQRSAAGFDWRDFFTKYT